MAPILSFTAEEIWDYMPDKAERPKSVFLSQHAGSGRQFADAELGERWERIFRERGEVLKALEQARSAGIIGHSLDAKVVFVKRGNPPTAKLSEWVNTDRARLQDLLIVSQADNGDETAPAANDGSASYDAPLLNCVIQVSKAEGAKCERCWKYDVKVGADHNHPTVCPRCAEVLNAGAAA